MKALFSELKVDPQGYVANLDSPIGVYLRKEVFGEETKADASLRTELYERTVAGQSADGSWGQLFVRTANSLWDHALLGYSAEDTSVKEGLEWLRSIQRYEYGCLLGFFHSGNRNEPRVMRSTLYGEFVPGCTLFYQTTYAVHLFHIFGLDDDRQVKTTVKSYLQLWGDREWVCGGWCGSNVLRILIEHPQSRDSRQVENGLKHLAERQTRTGAWKRASQSYPFYNIFHALSRSEHPLAKEQLEKAFPSIIRRQNKDGSWGRKARETKAYLVLDALKNAGAI